MNTFSQIESRKNIERGKGKLEPFTGEFKEIDMFGEWYCPRCKSKNRKLQLSQDSLTLHCPDHYLCEYEYCNKDGRDKYKMFLTARYRYPISLTELEQHLLETNIKRLNEIDSNISDLIKVKKEILLEIVRGNKKCVD